MKDIFTGIKVFVVMAILTGFVYPLIITLVGQTVFPAQSNGQLDLIAQKFDQPNYFWGRPSAVDYNPLPSGGSNLSPTSKLLQEQIEKRRNGDSNTPPDLLYASASGLDPHISPAAALFQVERVAKARGYNSAQKDEIIKLIGQLTEGRDWGIFGEPRVNVLRLNGRLF